MLDFGAGKVLAVDPYTGNSSVLVGPMSIIADAAASVSTEPIQYRFRPQYGNFAEVCLAWSRLTELASRANASGARRPTSLFPH